MAAWRMDTAALVPWRLDLARVQLALGRQQEAVRLLEDQLDPAHTADERTRGAALRLLAGLVPAEQGRQLLARSVKLLESCGDRRELARALDTTPAPERRAHSRASAEAPLCAGESEAERAEPLGGLSEAESRVAALAAQGHTNRQISSKLFITVSTVEQHLTRIYRKLDVKQRTDLATRLAAVGAHGK